MTVTAVCLGGFAVVWAAQAPPETAITQADVGRLIKAVEQAGQAFLTGRDGEEAQAVFVRDQDMTIFGAFGGEVTRGFGNVENRQANARSGFPT